jgi:hypothetical protein
MQKKIEWNWHNFPDLSSEGTPMMLGLSADESLEASSHRHSTQSMLLID